MIEMTRILCPVDFSEPSRHALEHAVALARWYESEVVALHVLHTPFAPQPPILFAEFSERAMQLADVESRQAEIRKWLSPVQQAGVNVDVVLDEGDPAARIIAQAKAQNASLIAMGTHGLTGFERAMLGSVAEKVLRRAACPVLTVPPTSVTQAKVPYTRILCPVDFSDSSLASVRFAASLAEEADAKLTILHVFDWPDDDDLILSRVDAEKFRQLAEEQGRSRLESLVTGEMRTWCKPTTKIDYGKPYRQILQTAEEDEMDVIVIGVRGRNPIDLTLFGSTTNQVVRRASCPVLTLQHTTPG